MSEILAYNPLAQISETFSWKTAVTPCWSAEERIALRDNPSLSITYSYAIGSDEKLRDFYDFSETNLGIPVRIPMWSSPHFHQGAVLSAETAIFLSDSLLHFYLYPGDEVILWKSPTSYSPLVIDTISSSNLSFTTAVGSDFSAFYILPLLTGRFNKAVSFTKGSGSRKRASLTFEVLNFVLSDPYDGYRVDKVLQSIEFSTATAQDREIVSSALGIYENLPTSEIIKNSWKGGFNFVSPSDLVDFLILLKSLKGRATSFTLPYTYLSPLGTSIVFSSSDSITIEHNFPRRAAVSMELEGSPDPTYQITPDITTVDEGSSVIFTVTTTSIPDGTTLYFSTSGTAVAADFVGASLTGSVVITGGTGTISRSIVEDATTEGSENFTLQLRLESVSGVIVATSSSVTINDTSLNDSYLAYIKVVIDSVDSVYFTGFRLLDAGDNLLGYTDIAEYPTLIDTRYNTPEGSNNWLGASSLQFVMTKTDFMVVKTIEIQVQPAAFSYGMVPNRVEIYTSTSSITTSTILYPNWIFIKTIPVEIVEPETYYSTIIN